MGIAPSVPTDRSRSMIAIGAGISRTGTLSLAMALDRLLDGPVMHGGAQILGREDSYVKLVYDAIRKRHDRTIHLKLLRDATAGFVGMSDLPAFSFVLELLEIYPEAKVVLVTRDPYKWAKSLESLAQNTTPWWLDYLLWPCPGWRWMPGIVRETMAREGERIPANNSGGVVKPEQLLEHTQWIKDNVPAEKLLIMDLKEGWQPLCRFLGKEVPDEPFPRANDSEAMDKVAKKMFVTAVMVWLGIIAAAGIGLWLSLKLL